MTAPDRSPPVALITYSNQPRGGVVHTLEVAEALAAGGAAIEVIALGRGFFRDVAAPWRTFPAPPRGTTLEERVFASVDALAEGLSAMGPSLPPILHTQDCISARAACRVRDAGAPVTVLRTVHHVDDFSTPALIDCQQRAIFEPDALMVVSRTWQTKLADDYGVDAAVVPNGVDGRRFAAPPPAAVTDALRAKIGAGERFVFLAVGGIEPRKGSDHLMRALAALKAGPAQASETTPPPMLAVVGGHSFQDHRAYRDQVIGGLGALGLDLGTDVVVVGTVEPDELQAWYHAADALAFPSVNEGWGLVVLEALAAGLPVVASDIPVFREYLRADVDALLVTPDDDHALCEALRAVSGDEALRNRLARRGRAVAGRFTWEASARRHAQLYGRVAVWRDAWATRGGGPARRPLPGGWSGCATDAADRCASAASRPR